MFGVEVPARTEGSHWRAVLRGRRARRVFVHVKAVQTRYHALEVGIEDEAVRRLDNLDGAQRRACTGCQTT